MRRAAFLIFAALASAACAQGRILPDGIAQRYAPGQLAGGADGLVFNPRTGQREPVYITYARDPDSGQQYETGYYFKSDGEVPAGAEPSAAAQFHSDNSGMFDDFLRRSP